MADRPILFSAPMIRALLAGTKTQTRRALKEPYGMLERLPDGEWKPIFTKVVSGDRLWVREAWCAELSWESMKPSALPQEAAIFYEADGSCRSNGLGAKFKGKNRPSMFMPRWASRLTLTVTDVRVERLQDISESDALAEGIDRLQFPERGDWGWPQQKYRELWNEINGAGAWEANPWVVAYSFTVHHGNIDKIAQVAA